MHTARGDGVAIIKRQRQDLHRDGVRDLAMASGRGQLKEDLESSTWRRHESEQIRAITEVNERLWSTRPMRIAPEGSNGNVKGVNGGVRGAPDFSTIIAQQLQNLLPAILAQVGNQGNDGNQNGNVVNENVQENVRNVSVNGNRIKTELWNHVMVGAGHAAYTDRFHELARLDPHLVTLESRKIKRYVYDLAPQIRGMVAATESKTIQKAVQISSTLADEAIRNGSIRKVEKRGNVGEPSKDKNGRNDNKRIRTGNAFATTANFIGRENTGAWPKCTTCNFFHVPRGPCHACFTYNRPGHLAMDCRVVPRNMYRLCRNPTPAHRACFECGSTDHLKPACPRLNRAQGPGGNRPNQVAANNGGIEPSELGFKYEIEIASGQLVEIDKVIKGFKLEIEGHVFDIDLIPFGHGRFDVIIGMEWLSNHKAEIICHEKVVRIPLLDSKVLIVLGEKSEAKERLFYEYMTSSNREIVVVRYFLRLVSGGHNRIAPVQEIEFRIELIPGATPVAKSL
ncbi:putative reverse transcriptase domain-containing protein [Tanacetum coccineum]|uniref:Reverse transcriptase domain-containing protein n=1 Tax=Tanacetum coccineum TaxID=301880 RepID=A0ABQ5AKQ4_9ASTR